MSEEHSEIEVLTLRHLPHIVGIMENVYQRTSTPIGGIWNRDLLKQELEIGQGVGLTVEGFGLAAFILFRLYDNHREITVLATHPDRQRKGDMHFLLTTMLEKKSPQERIWLEVHDRNQAALTLYTNMGFQQVGRRPKYYRDGGDALLLTLG
ncbi:MAG: GNAT family N-acetyltransferase [Bdellovibrionales bacterium]|nr:GNAT family N-acetyltransferase [Bdellovibrionales bacterium]